MEACASGAKCQVSGGNQGNKGLTMSQEHSVLSFRLERACAGSLRLAPLVLVLLFLPGFRRAAMGQDLGQEGFQTQTETNFVSPAEGPVFTNQAPLAPRLSTSGSQLAAQPAVAAVSAQPLAQWGPVGVRPHVFYSLSYGNGLQALPGQQSDTLINEIDPGVLFQVGDHWTLDYTPTLRYYSSRLFKDTFDNSVVLAGTTTYRDWTFGLSQSYVSSSEPIVEAAAQLDTETYATAVTATYQISTPLSLQLAANQNFQYLAQNVPGEQLTDWKNWSTLDWLNYQIDPAVAAAIGVGFEYDNLSLGPDMTSEQYQGRITWHPGSKLSCVLSGGLQDRQFLVSGVPDLLTPVYAFTVQYQLFEPTALSLSASRVVSPSFLENQITESTLVTGGIQQRLLGKFNLSVTGSYGSTTFQGSAPTPGPTIASNFDTTSLNVALSTVFLRRATASIFYQLAYFSSGSAIYNYTTTQVGMTLGYRF